MSGMSFEELYCRNNNIGPERYERAIMGEVLYPHARWFYHVVLLFNPGHFAADLDFVRNVGNLRRFRNFSEDVQQFMHHPANTGALRRTFNVRVSTKRLRRLVRTTLHPGKFDSEEDETAAPFEHEQVVDKRKKRSRTDNQTVAKGS